MEPEVVNQMYLATALLLVLNLVQWLRYRAKAKTIAHQKYILGRDIVSLRREAEKLNTPSTFAKCAKFQRMANMKEKELAQLEHRPDLVDNCLIGVKVAACAALAIVCWGRPIGHVLPEHVWPMHRLLDFSYSRLSALTSRPGAGGGGAVYMLPWLLLCDRVSKLVVRAVVPLPRAPAAQAGALAEGVQAAEALR